MKHKSKPFNIVIYPPDNVIKKAVSISRNLRSKGGQFVLDNVKYYPHITLYQGEFPLTNLYKIKKSLENFTSELKPFSMNSLKYRQNETGYVDIEYIKTKVIEVLQKNIIRLVNPLREGLMKKSDIDELDKFGIIQQKNISRYGFGSVGSNYFPHLTFTKLRRYNKDILSSIGKQEFSFKADKISLFYLGEYGTCRKLVEIFDL